MGVRRGGACVCRPPFSSRVKHKHATEKKMRLGTPWRRGISLSFLTSPSLSSHTHPQMYALAATRPRTVVTRPQCMTRARGCTVVRAAAVEVRRERDSGKDFALLPTPTPSSLPSRRAPGRRLRHSHPCLPSTTVPHQHRPPTHPHHRVLARLAGRRVQRRARRGGRTQPGRCHGSDHRRWVRAARPGLGRRPHGGHQCSPHPGRRGRGGRDLPRKIPGRRAGR